MATMTACCASTADPWAAATGHIAGVPCPAASVAVAAVAAASAAGPARQGGAASGRWRPGTPVGEGAVLP